ncbi:hypothetical protein PYW08_007367 [Mythimna loreyi]|uniref:Uncharacterized protein n=1 Tax=Mythimna loreyi TaxID=667449 RepID=A0ACC2RBF5_9NEOP|nr:hypothetical protein PYW08_007367 [Mythimna loreyi]
MASAQETGLECLIHLDNVVMNQLVSSYKGNNYTVYNGQEVLFNLVEDTEGLSLLSGGSHRGFHMNGVDNFGRKVFSLRRPGMSISDKVEVFMHDQLVSVVRMESTFLTPVFSINDAHDCPVLRLKGKITDTSNYKLQTQSKTTIGSIHKKTHDTLKDALSRKDDYAISFPGDLALNFKLAVIVASVLIDFRFHEYK